jgi:hypothetical protein
MNRSTVFLIALAAFLGALGFACSKEKESASQEDEPPKEYMVMGEFVNPQDTLPRVRYYDSDLVSLNDRCAVRKIKLNIKMPPVYVNGQPIGFC